MRQGTEGGSALAGLLGGSLWAFIGSRTSAFFILPLITYAEVEIAHHLRTGAWITLDRHHVIEQAKELLLDWFMGTIPVGGALAAALGFTAYALARSRAHTKRSEHEGSKEKEE